MRYRWLLLLAVVGVVAVSIAASPVSAGGSCRGGPFSDVRTTQVQMVAGCFSPTVARIDPGDTVTFVNDDSQVHMVGGVAASFGNLHEAVTPDKELSYRLDEEGVYPYLCILHPGMGGAIVVGDGVGKVTAGASSVANVLPGADAAVGVADPVAPPVGPDAKSSWWLPAAAALGGAGLALLLVWSRRRDTSTLV